jgi:signal transduction histidine kinase
MPTRDLSMIMVLTAASCTAVGLAGLLAVRLLRPRALRLSVVLAGLVPVVAVAVSVLVNVNAMFLSRHDSAVVLVALAWAVVIAGGLSVAVAHSVSVGALAVREGLRRLNSAEDAAPAHKHGPLPPAGHRSAIAAAPTAAAPAELASLAAELEVFRERLQGSRHREQALEQSRRELVAFMSHDLRTPLAGLRALAEGVEDGVIDDVPAAMVRIRSTVDRLSLLVEDLFELSRVTGGGQRRPRRLVSLAEVSMDVLSEAGDHARARGVRLVHDLPDSGDRLPVLGDADELVRAMTNLVANAVRHTATGGSVHLVGNRGSDGQIRIAVVDGCGGIPDADLAHVFEAGWRGSPARTTQDGGAGLGLAIARGVAESHDGRILVENVNGGCRFELALPGAR